MKRRRLISSPTSAVFCAIIALVACSSEDPAPIPAPAEATVTVTVTATETANPSTVTPSGEAQSTTPSPTAPTEPPSRSPRGALIKQVGEDAALIGDSGSFHVQFSVTDIDVAYECTGYDESPDNGLFIGVWLDVTTTPELAEAPWPDFDVSDWLVVDDNGALQNADPLSVAAMMCSSNNEALPHRLDPGLTARGVVVLDVTTPSGSVILNQGGAPAWEWRYGN